jgi:hypothetical protein
MKWWLPGIVGPALWYGSANADVLYNVTIDAVYAQSRSGSDANLIRVSAALPTQCNTNRLYVLFDDKELFASALANYIAGKPVHIIFVTNAAPVVAVGHLGGLTCQLISIFS